MPDGKSAKKVIKGVLKQHKKGLSIEGLKKDVRCLFIMFYVHIIVCMI